MMGIHTIDIVQLRNLQVIMTASNKTIVRLVEPCHSRKLGAWDMRQRVEEEPLANEKEHGPEHGK
jgi:hypothetical protein